MRSAEDVEIEVLKKADEHTDARVTKLETRVGVIEAGVTWVVGAGVGMAALAALIKSGVLKMLAGMGG